MRVGGKMTIEGRPGAGAGATSAGAARVECRAARPTLPSRSKARACRCSEPPPNLAPEGMHAQADAKT
eukprot:925612-Pleurochrysis_carterae.AAC.1